MDTWNDITQLVLSNPAHQDIVVHKSLVPHPLSEGFDPRLGDFQGQTADFGKALPDGRGIHIREFADEFKVHWDHVDPSVDPIGHLISDATHWVVIGFIAISLLLFGLFVWLRNKE